MHVGVNSLLANSTLYHPLVNMRKPLGFAGLLAICWPYMHTARLVRVLGEWMKNFLSGAMLIAGFALATSAQAAPGECSVSGYDTFACDVSVDGGGITFELPDGKMFVFSQTVVGEGLGYLIAADARPGSLPEELGAFVPLADEPGCWLGSKDDMKFCAALLQ